MTDQPELLKADEVAERLRVSKMTVYRLAHDGTLATTRVGRSFRFHAASVNALIGSPFRG